MYELVNPTNFPIKFSMNGEELSNHQWRINSLEITPIRSWRKYNRLICTIRRHHTWAYASLRSDDVEIFSDGFCKYCGRKRLEGYRSGKPPTKRVRKRLRQGYYTHLPEKGH